MFRRIPFRLYAMARRPHFLEPLLAASGACELRVEGREAPAASLLVGAFDSESRRRGLLGKDGLPAGEALAIAPCNAVHTFFMRFAIDVVFAARDGRVLAIRRAVEPWRLAMCVRAFATIEFAAGGASTAGLSVGDVLFVQAEQ
jgi:uncharacterized membrane protein (UPF0127 family)